LDIYDYDKLLDRLRESLPPQVFEHARFTIPKVISFVEGGRTIIKNFKEIANTLDRKPEHLMKFLLRELATAGSVSDTQAVFQGRFSKSTLDNLIERYTKEYVICPECQRPDTSLEKMDRYTFLVCKACGARTSVKSI